MKRYEIKKIDIGSVMRVYITFSLIIGLVFGVLFILNFANDSSGGMFVAVIGAFLAILGYTLVGMGIVALITWMYNLLAQRVGGVIVYIQDEIYLTPATKEKSPNDQQLT